MPSSSNDVSPVSPCPVKSLCKEVLHRQVLAANAEEEMEIRVEEPREASDDPDGSLERPAREATAEGVVEDSPLEAPERRLSTDHILPTEAEIEEHMKDHLPYRIWCPHCLRAKARENVQLQGTGSEREVPVFAFDYMFLRDTGGQVSAPRPSADEIENEIFKGLDAQNAQNAEDVNPIEDNNFVEVGDHTSGADPVGSEKEGDRADNLVRQIEVLVAKDSKTQVVFAHVVPRKGVDEEDFAVECLTQDIKTLGYSHIALKSDQEPAIVKLLEEPLNVLKVDTRRQDGSAESSVVQINPEHSAAYDPQSNGLAESAVQSVKNHALVLKLGLEARASAENPVVHPLMHWLVEHAAFFSLNIRNRGSDGRTPYMRLKGKEFPTVY